MKFIGPSQLHFDLVLCIQDPHILFDQGVDRLGVDGVLPLVGRFEEGDLWRATNTTRVRNLMRDPHFPSYAAGIPLFCNGMPVALGQFQAHLILCKHWGANEPFALIDSLEKAVTWAKTFEKDGLATVWTLRDPEKSPLMRTLS